MEQNSSRHVALHAPNILCVCIDKYDAGDASGRIHHCYDESPIKFANVVQFMESVDNFYDQISFPQASTQTRAFFKTEPSEKLPKEKVRTPIEIASERGEVATFLLHVKYRQNSCWQGEVELLESGKTEEFVSVLELIKIVNNFLRG